MNPLSSFVDIARIAIIFSTTFVFLTASGYATVLIGSFDATRSSRAFTGTNYDNIRSDLLNPTNFPAGSVAISPGISSATAAALSPFNMFIVSEVSSLTAAEVTALTNFVFSGNSLVLVSDTSSAARFGANAMLAALDGGSISDPNGGSNGSAVGTFVGSTSATNGPFGNLVGGTFAASLASSLNAGSSSTVIGSVNAFGVLLEIPFGSLGPGSGAVLAMSDVVLMNFFVPPASLPPGNSNNSRMFLNFVAHQLNQGPSVVPEPSTLAIAVIFGLSSPVLLRRRRVKNFSFE